VSYAQFARLLGFGRKDASRAKIHMTLKLDARKIKFMYSRSKQGNFDDTTDMLSFYAYINWQFRRTIAPREGDRTKILTYNKNILAAMAPNANGFEFSLDLRGSKGYLRESSQELRICSLSYAYDWESDC
jgi:hypothetical protein